MPALKNIRHEQFARNLVEITKSGGTRAAAYTASGYRAKNGAAEANASRLLSDAKAGVAQRVEELMLNGAKRAEVTVASLLAELEEARAGAQDDKQFAAATSAAMAKAKLSGMLVDKVEIGGPGEFDGCASITDVIRKLLADEPASELLASIDAFREQIANYAADHAQIVVTTDPARPVPGRETEQAMALFRPKHRPR
jgi:phage terminase small subunit